METAIESDYSKKEKLFWNTENLNDFQYDLELDRIIKEIKKRRAKTVLIQMPDGLKPKAAEIADFLEKNTSTKILIWMGSCFGACDVPNLGKMEKKVDLLVQFGHNRLKSK